VDRPSGGERRLVRRRLLGHRLLGHRLLGRRLLSHGGLGHRLLLGGVLAGGLAARLVDGIVEVFQRAQAERHGIARAHVLHVPMRAVAHRLDGALGRADQLGNLRVLQFGMNF
jgi:hypothetical protein